MDDFEAFTREKIERLRAEADALEKILKEFQATKARLAGAARRSGGDNPRAGALGAIMDALAEAGPNGLSLDEMIEAAADAGFEVKRTTLRAQIWRVKEEGRVVPLDKGRYRIVPDGIRAVSVGEGNTAFVVDPSAKATRPAKPDFDDYGFTSTPPKEPGKPYGHTEYRQDARGNMVPMKEPDLDDEIPF